MKAGRVLLTGASGFIGRHCLEALLRGGSEVHAVSRFPQSEEASGLFWHRADLLEPGGLDHVFAKQQFTHVLHAAWEVSGDNYWNSAANLLWAARSIEL